MFIIKKESEATELSEMQEIDFVFIEQAYVQDDNNERYQGSNNS
jgi:hypothetical protein